MSPVPVQTQPMGGLQIPDPANAWVVELDPDEVAVDRSELDINDPAGRISISQAGIDWGDAAIQEFLADQAVGSTLVDYRLPNRTVTINLNVGDGNEANYLASKAALQQKVALIQREGGWLKRDTGVPLYADVVNATLTFPDHWGAVAFMEDGVKLVLECVPDFYGDEVTLDVMTGTGQIVGVLGQAGVQALIAGDHPGRCRIIVTDTSGQYQQGVIWGFRSRRYSPASTSALFYDAQDLDRDGTPASLAGSYGTTVVEGTSATWPSGGSGVTLELPSALLTHIGAYRVWVRAQGVSGAPRLALSWLTGNTFSSSGGVNGPVAPPTNGAWYILDLGVIQIDRVPVGTTIWRGGLFATDLAGGTNIVAIDRIWLQPLDESAGVAASGQLGILGSAVFASSTSELRTEGIYASNSAAPTNYGSVPLVTGDLPRIPPSGPESRAVELFVKPSRGQFANGAGGLQTDPGMDGLTAQVIYRPSYLFPA